jgi:hypothetical protein
LGKVLGKCPLWKNYLEKLSGRLSRCNYLEKLPVLSGFVVLPGHYLGKMECCLYLETVSGKHGLRDFMTRIMEMV